MSGGNIPNIFTDKRILLVNTGSTKKRFIIQKLKKLGIKIIVLNKEKNWAQSYVDDWIIADTNNHQESIQAIRDFYSNNHDLKIDGALTFWEDDVLLTSKITDRFNLVGIPYSIAKKVRNKILFRDFCQKNNLPTPKHKHIKSIEEIADVIKEISFPLVIKPAYGSSSAYVMKVENEIELINAYQFIQSNLSIKIESALTEGNDILVEEYIDGDEVDIDIILQNGKIKFYSITDNYQTNEPFFVETGQSIPSSLPIKNQNDLIDMAEEMLEKLGIQNGIIHFEAKSTKHGPVPIEINLRMGGDEVYSFVKDAWNIDLIENAIKVACQIHIPKIKKPEIPRKFIAGEYFLPENTGVLVKLDIAEKIKKDSNLEELHFLKEVGDEVLVPPEGYEYLGWLTVSGTNTLDASDNLKKLKKMVHYEVAKFQEDSSLGKTERKGNLSFASMNKNLILRRVKFEKIRKLSIQNQRNLHVGIAGNLYDITSTKNIVENNLMSVGLNVKNTLEKRGYRVSFINFNDYSSAINQLQTTDIDIIFNVCERINNSSLLEPHVAAIFDILQIPYTGSNPFTLSLCIDKIRVKKLLTFHNIPTPKWDYIYDLKDSISNDLNYPLIVKPSNTDNSIGITNDSIVTNRENLMKQLEKIINEYKSPALIEEYIEGDEYDVSIIGSEVDDLRILPLSRSIFSKLPANYWHIYPITAKFQADETYKKIIVQRPPKNIPKKLESLISEIALDTYNILDCHDYGRVEIRVDKNHNPYVLELNPNPSINFGDCVPEVANIVGMDYGDFLEEIIRLCIKRYKDRPPYNHLQIDNF